MQEKDISISGERANVMSLPFALPAVGMVITYGWVHGFARLNAGLEYMFMPWVFLPVLLIGIVAHEFIHGLTWALCAPRGWKSIRFGFILKALTPYASCIEALKIDAYRLGAMMPGFSLGLLPFVAALIADWPAVAMFGVFFTFAACGDFWVLYTLRHEPRSALVLDHPSRIGCIVRYPD